MTDEGTSELEEGPPRRFDIELFVVNPTLDPADITAALGLKAHIEHRVGEPRKTPKGTPLPGTYRDTRWRHSVRHTVEDQWFADRLSDLVNRLMARETFLAEVKSTGGRASVIVQFLGDATSAMKSPPKLWRSLSSLVWTWESSAFLCRSHD